MPTRRQVAFGRRILAALPGVMGTAAWASMSPLDGTVTLSLPRGVASNGATRIEIRPTKGISVRVRFLKGDAVLSDHPSVGSNDLGRLFWFEAGIATLDR